MKSLQSKGDLHTNVEIGKTHQKNGIGMYMQNRGNEKHRKFIRIGVRMNRKRNTGNQTHEV
jgi:hypothetical protein